MTSLPVIGWIGAGRMGVPIAGFILQAGYPLIVSSRSAQNRAKLVAQGAREAASVAECARDADIVFSSVPDDNALRETALGPQGVLANAKRGAIYADTSTVSPAIASEVEREAAARGIDYLRLPISGNAKQALSADLTCFGSGPEAAWNRIKPVLETFSKAQIYLGAGGEAIYMKLVTNLVVVNTAQAIAEALALGRKAGLDWELMLDTLSQSAIASPWLKAKVGTAEAARFHGHDDDASDPEGHRFDARCRQCQRRAAAAHRDDAPDHADVHRPRLRRRRLHGDRQAGRRAVGSVERAH